MPDQRNPDNFVALRHGDPVAFDARACLIVRRPGAECGLCRDACPKAVLGGGEWSIALDIEGCIGCGLCAAACPTGAFLVEGFEMAPRDEPVARAVECARVPEALRHAGAEIVPCLGGLSAPDLLDRAAAGGAVLIDRGLCETCGVGCGPAPWAAALAAAQAAGSSRSGMRRAPARENPAPRRKPAPEPDPDPGPGAARRRDIGLRTRTTPMTRLPSLLLVAALLAAASDPAAAQNATARPANLGSESGNFGLTPFAAVPSYALTDAQTGELRALEDSQLAARRALEDRFAAEMRALMAIQAEERATLLARFAGH